MRTIHTHLFHRWFLCTILFISASPTPLWAQEVASRFLVISDFHFDPFDGLNREQFQKLAVAPIEEWPGILASQPPAAYGRDAPLALVESSLSDARQRLADPDFILCPGDFLAHNWQDKYDRLAEKPRAQDPRAYRAFTTNAVRLLADRIRRAFPKTPFYPVLGNDDSYCGDYMIGPDSDFLSMFAEVFEPLLHAETMDVDPAKFCAMFAPGGHYTIRLPHLRNHRLVALNTVFFATQYENACGSSTATPSLDQLAWLETTLAAAESANETIWLLMHIPAGVDSYRTSRTRGDAKGFWQPELTSQFLKLVQRYQATIQFAFAGHTHMDDFRLVRLEGKSLLLTKIVPAISPIFGNNPGYQAFEYDRETGAVQNYKTFFLAMTRTGPQAAPGAPASPLWRVEYDFRDAYRLSELNVAAIDRLADDLANGGPFQKPYLQYYSVSGPAVNIELRVLNCAIGNVTVSGCNACLSATRATSR